MSSNRTEPRYSLRNRDVPRQDHSRESILRLSTEAHQDELTDRKMEQLIAALTELAKLQQDQQRRSEENQRVQEERRREEEELRKQQYAEHQEQVKRMHELYLQQMESVKEVLKEREAANPHLKIAPYQEKEDIQDFLEAFEGIMKIQKVNKASWVLRLTPLLSGKARTVCTDLGPTNTYEAVKRAILEHYEVNAERCRKRFRAHTWTKDQEPTDWITKGKKLARRWLTPDEGVNECAKVAKLNSDIYYSKMSFLVHFYWEISHLQVQIGDL